VTNHDPVFTSVGQALHVSFLMEVLPVTQKVSTQVLIQNMRQQAGKEELREASSINKAGLSPMDFSAECAKVRKRVDIALWHPAEKAAIWTRFGWQATQGRGVQELASYFGPMLNLSHKLGASCILWHLYHRGNRKGLTLRKIEEETGIAKSTLHRAADVVRRSVDDLDARAQSRLGPIFEELRFVVAADLTRTLQTA